MMRSGLRARWRELWVDSARGRQGAEPIGGSFAFDQHYQQKNREKRENSVVLATTHEENGGSKQKTEYQTHSYKQPGSPRNFGPI
jgi:hypothetical protein